MDVSVRPMARLGRVIWTQGDDMRHAAAVIGTVLGVCVRPWCWERPAWNLLARQVLVVGVEPLGFVSALAVFVGISIVEQLSFWLGEAGQSELLGPLLVVVVARELGPLLINFVVIVRSGSAMTTEHFLTLRFPAVFPEGIFNETKEGKVNMEKAVTRLNNGKVLKGYIKDFSPDQNEVTLKEELTGVLSR